MTQIVFVLRGGERPPPAFGTVHDGLFKPLNDLVDQVTPVVEHLTPGQKWNLRKCLRRLDGLDIDYEDTVPLVEALVARVLGLDR